MPNLNASTTLKTGELARRAGVNVETLRFYERKGLLPEPPRRVSGYREYTEGDVRRVCFIRRAQSLGFTLAEVSELLGLRVGRGTTAADVKARAERKLADVRRKIAKLAEIERALVGLTASCDGRSPTGDCPILHHLEGDE
jgi:Hg(II)-responsive transcriptional regulator